MKKPIDRNTRLAWTMVLIVGGMLGLSYAAVPLYEAFCRATGFGGTPLIAQSDDHPVIARTMVVRFDSNTDPGLPWRFEPEQRSVTVHLGEQKLVYFRATNKSDHAIVGHAAFNVSPGDVARYFDKIQCFCFTEQKLEPGESVEMPVTFFVSPDLAKDQEFNYVDQITLSYTFYRAVDQKTAVSTVASAKAAGG